MTSNDIGDFVSGFRSFDSKEVMLIDGNYTKDQLRAIGKE
jgi:hypothetical protein